MTVVIIPKKEGTTRFIADYQNRNQILVIYPYSLSIIREKMEQLEGFHYATALELKMVYYTIEILPESRNLTTIFTEFGTFRYNRVPMRLCASSVIFHI